MTQVATCPVCGMSIDVGDDTPSSRYEGVTYYFCSEACKTTFDQDPAKYV